MLSDRSILADLLYKRVNDGQRLRRLRLRTGLAVDALEHCFDRLHVAGAGFGDQGIRDQIDAPRLRPRPLIRRTLECGLHRRQQ